MKKKDKELYNEIFFSILIALIIALVCLLLVGLNEESNYDLSLNTNIQNNTYHIVIDCKYLSEHINDDTVFPNDSIKLCKEFFSELNYEKVKLEITKEEPSWYLKYYESDDLKNIEINNQKCYEVPCDCHSGKTYCTKICYKCEDKVKEIGKFNIVNESYNIYGFIFGLNLSNLRGDTLKEKKVYFLISTFDNSIFPMNITLSEDYSKTYNRIIDIPLEDDCIEIKKYNESCFIKWEILK